MATTALFVEIVVVGAIAELWIVSVLLATLERSQTATLLDVATRLKDFGPIITIFVLAMTYAVGWVANFASEWLFKMLFEKSLRDPLFKKLGRPYEAVRTEVLLEASPDFMREVDLDRHIIRVARTNALSFLALAASLALHWRVVAKPALVFGIVLFTILSIASFFQWRRRYIFQYVNLANAAVHLAAVPPRS